MPDTFIQPGVMRLSDALEFSGSALSSTVFPEKNVGRFDRMRNLSFKDRILSSSISNKIIDSVAGGMSLEESEGLRSAEIERYKSLIPDVERVSVMMTKVQMPDYIIAKAVSREPIFTEQETNSLLRTLDTVLKPFARVIEPFRETTHTILDRDFGNIIQRAMGAFINPDQVETLTSRAPLTEFERGGGIGRLVPRAVVEAIEQVAFAQLAFGGTIRTAAQRAKEVQYAKVRTEIESLLPQIERAGAKFPQGMTSAQKVDAVIQAASVRTDAGKFLNQVLTRTGPLGRLMSERGLAQIPFKVGDTAKIGKETGKIIKIEGPKAILNVAGKEVAKDISELQRTRRIQKTKIQKSIDKVTNVVKDVEKIQIKEDIALRSQIRSEVRAARDAFKAGKRDANYRRKIKDISRKLNQLVETEEKIQLAMEIEELAKPAFSIESNTANEHLSYFQSIQLPQGSKVKSMQQSIRRILSLKKAKKIPSKRANKELRKLREDIFKQAKKENVSIRMTDGGKVMLSIRDAGTFVPEDFSNWKRFKDLETVAGGGTDITRTIQGIDGSLTLKEKANLPDQAGPMEKYVLWRTRDMWMQKINYINEKTALIKKIMSKIRPNSKQDAAITNILREINSDDALLPNTELMARENISRITNNPEIVKKAQQLRKFYDDVIDEQNAAREMRNQPPILYRQNYSPEILRDATLWEKIQDIGKESKDIISSVELPDYIHPNKPFNPREMAREYGIKYEDRIHSSYELAENYLGTASRDIFNTSIIQNNKAFIQQLETMGFKKSALTIADWTSEAYVGLTPKLDRAINVPRNWKKGMIWFNRIRNLAVFPFNFAWNLTTQISSLALTVGRYGYINSLRGLLSWFDSKTRIKTSKEYYSFVVKAYKQGKITKQDLETLKGEGVKIYESPADVVEDFAFLLTDSIEKTLTGASIEAARIHGSSRGLKGEALKQYASDGGSKTQSLYNREDKPGILRNLTITTSFPYQTFAYEIRNTLREWLGRTGTPPDDQIERLFILIRFFSATIVFQQLAQLHGRSVWDWTRPPVPFAEQWLNPMIARMKGEYYDRKRLLPSPLQAALSLTEGMDDVLEKGEWRKLRNELLRWLPGVMNIPGGVQLSRMVDAIISYSRGGVFDRSGKKMFSIKTEEDFMKALFSGVWSTKGGQEWLKKRRKSIPEKYFKKKSNKIPRRGVF